jgi:hypothetical protein
MFRIADVPEATFLAEIAAIERELLELKAAQRVGADSIITHLTKTANTWDVDQTVAASSSVVWWEVVFTPTHGGTPYSEFGFDWLVTTDSGFEYFSMFPSPSYIAGSGVAFIVEYSNPNFTDVNVKLKFSVKSVDTGSLSWSVVRS